MTAILEVISQCIPQALKTRRQWVLWKLEARDDEDKPTKVPYQANGYSASTKSTSTWGTFNNIWPIYETMGGYSGIAYVMAEKDPYTGIDLDDCIDEEGNIDPWADRIVNNLNSYTEISPSGNGIRIFVEAIKPGDRCRTSKHPGIEIYSKLRLLSLTGHRLPGIPETIEKRQSEIEELYHEIFTQEEQSQNCGQPRISTLEDEHLIEKALNAANGEKFQRLFILGDTSDYGGDHSGADLGLCNKLAFWTGRDAGQMDRLFRCSALMRPKWDEARGVRRYGEMTIERAIRDCTEIYQPSRTSTIGGEVFSLEDFCYEIEDKDGNPKFVFSPTTATSSIIAKSQLRMADNEADIYRFDDQIYRPDGERKIDLQICRAVGDRVRGRDIQEVIRRVKNELLEDPVIFDCNPYLLGVKNGVVDLRTGEFRDYRPEDLITYQIDVTYDPAARCPRYLKFLEEIQPNVTDRLTLVDWYPATAIRLPLPYVLFLLGLGRNGKGIYERLIKRFFGAAAFRDMALAEVSKNNFAAGTFYKKLGWIATEQSGKRKATIGIDFIKLVTGAGSIDADVKNKARIQFEAYFQVIVDTNAMPVIEDTSIGWMERFCKQDLPYVFVDNPDPDNPLERKKDPHLLDKLTIDEELSGILNLLIWRAKEICETETITKRPASELFTEYTKQSASVSTFCDLFLEYEGGLTEPNTPTVDIYQAYKRWCSYLVGEVVDEAYFGRYLRRLCNNRQPSRPRRGNQRLTAYPGLLFNEDKVEVAIEALSKGWTGRDGHGQVVDEKDFSKTDNKSTSGTSGQVELWNQIIKRFGPCRPEVQEEDFLSKEEIHQNTRPTRPLVPPIASDLKNGKSIRPLPVTTSPLAVQGDEEKDGGVEVAGDSEPSKAEYIPISELLEEADRREADYLDHFRTPDITTRSVDRSNMQEEKLPAEESDLASAATAAQKETDTNLSDIQVDDDHESPIADERSDSGDVDEECIHGKRLSDYINFSGSKGLTKDSLKRKLDCAEKEAKEILELLRTKHNWQIKSILGYDIYLPPPS